MFVERLTKEQVNLVAKEVVTPKCYKFEASLFDGICGRPCIKILVHDREHGKFSILVFDNYFYSTILLKELRGKEKQAFNVLYKIFGDEYKEFYMENVNKIFEI